MPIYERQDNFGRYYQYGNHGAKYYFISSQASQQLAYRKAVRQAQAIHSNQNRHYQGGGNEYDLIRKINHLLI